MSGLGFTTIFSLKGGVGKTSLASALCLELDYKGKKVPIITNDAISPLEEVLGKEKALKLKIDEDFPELKKSDDIIVDLGGFVDERSISALKKSKQVVIPTIGSFLSISGLIQTVQEVERFNKKIIIVLNRIEKKEVEKVIQFIRENHDYPIFKLKTSKCFENLLYQNKSVSQMMKEEPLRRSSYKEVHAQLHEIIKHLTRK
jgi:cellulose biosynthesis protein BcsQ